MAPFRPEEAIPGRGTESLRFRIGGLCPGVFATLRESDTAGSSDDDGSGGLAQRPHHAEGEKRLLPVGLLRYGTLGWTRTRYLH